MLTSCEKALSGPRRSKSAVKQWCAQARGTVTTFPLSQVPQAGENPFGESDEQTYDWSWTLVSSHSRPEGTPTSCRASTPNKSASGRSRPNSRAVRSRRSSTRPTFGPASTASSPRSSLRPRSTPHEANRSACSWSVPRSTRRGTGCPASQCSSASRSSSCSGCSPTTGSRSSEC
jgi:hypothetical protein